MPATPPHPDPLSLAEQAVSLADRLTAAAEDACRCHPPADEPAAGEAPDHLGPVLVREEELTAALSDLDGKAAHAPTSAPEALAAVSVACTRTIQAVGRTPGHLLPDADHRHFLDGMAELASLLRALAETLPD